MQTDDKTTMSRKKGWTVLLSCLFLVYLFGVSIGPWLQQYIPGMDEIVTVMEKNDIDGGAYYYTEIEGAADGYAYLSQSLRFFASEHYSLNLPFLSGIVICLLLLFFGFRLLPR
ncbi:MAG: hypothetical protein RQ739_10450 [Desulfotignum sp.]|jgi:hypothetical protein|nr:hypothetical protein [Desulfotignum sp.]